MFFTHYISIFAEKMSLNTIRSERKIEDIPKEIHAFIGKNNEVKNGSEGRPLFGTALLRLK